MDDRRKNTKASGRERLQRARNGAALNAGAVLLALLAVMLVASAPPGGALPKKGEDEPGCLPGSRASIESVNYSGTREGTRILLNTNLAVSAKATIQRVLPNCDVTRTDVPLTFSLTPPAGSAATVPPGPANSVSFRPDVIGDYVLTLRSCAANCGSGYASVVPALVTTRLTAVARLAPAPKSAPVVPAEPHTDPITVADKDTKCAGGGGIVDPQWVPVSQWNGPQDYKLLQGEVVGTRVSRKDSPLNHDSQDVNAHVLPDPMFKNMNEAGHRDMEVEWERDHFPDVVRPSVGDRIAAWGFHIVDCGHDYPIEIHPPVGVAVSRARAIDIPESANLALPGGTSIGKGVTVPGIDTVIWFHPQAGEITSNCSGTGLHQPARLNPQFGQVQNAPKYLIGACIRGPHPTRRAEPYEFDIYLPPNPSEAGKVPIPLYVEGGAVEGLGAPGPAPRIEVRPGSLHVTLDFSNGEPGDYSYRIRAAWAYPSPDNWSAKGMRVKFTKMDVHDDGDGVLRGDGDWRFWMNVPSRTKEWTKLFDSDGSVSDGVTTFGNRPWSTGPGVSADRWLGPDPVVFPGQSVHIHTSGYEADTVVDDDTGAVDLRVTATTRTVTASSACGYSEPEIDHVLQSECASYTATFTIDEVPLPAPVLSPAATTLWNAYGVGAPTGNGGVVVCQICDQVAAPQTRSAALARVAPPRAVPVREIDAFESEWEKNVLTEALPSVVSAKLVATRTEDPQKL